MTLLDVRIKRMIPTGVRCAAKRVLCTRRLKRAKASLETPFNLEMSRDWLPIEMLPALQQEYPVRQT